MDCVRYGTKQRVHKRIVWQISGSSIGQTFVWTAGHQTLLVLLAVSQVAHKMSSRVRHLFALFWQSQSRIGTNPSASGQSVTNTFGEPEDN